MSLPDEFERLRTLHDSGTLTDAEFADAKTKVLAENQPSAAVANSSIQRDLRRLQIQNEILSLDQNWSVERENYLLRTRYGSRIVPTTANALIQAIVLVVVGMFFFATGFPSGTQTSNLSPIGFVFFLLGIGIGIYGTLKAKAYDEAYDQYQQKRLNLTDQLAALGG